MLKLFSYFYWFLVGIIAVLFFPISCIFWLISFFDKKKKLLHYWTTIWASFYSWINPLWKVKVLGKENIDPNKVYIMISNHQSVVDIFIIYRIFAHFKWVSKIENFSIPIIGWNMKLNEYIPLDRGKIKSNFKMLKDCSSALKNGNSIMIFPEGTRSTDGKLKSFKAGAFQLAIENKIGILPIFISGTANALPKGGIILQGKQEIQIQIEKEIPFDSFADKDVEELTSKVHAFYEEKLNGKT